MVLQKTISLQHCSIDLVSDSYMGMLVPQKGYFVAAFISVRGVLFFSLDLLCNSYDYKSYLISFSNALNFYSSGPWFSKL